MSKNKVIFNQLLVCDADHLILPPDADQSLSPSERARLAKIVHPTQAKLFLLGRYLLRQLLARQLSLSPSQIPITLNNKGKPQLFTGDAISEWHFNISHTHSLLALALSNQAPLGIDLETRRLTPAQIMRLARRYFSLAEQHWLHSAPSAENFLQLWTLKEAVLKAHGAGIANNLAAIHWQPEQAQAQFAQQDYQLSHYQVDAALGLGRLTLALQGDISASWLHLKLADLPLALEISGVQPNLSISHALSDPKFLTFQRDGYL